MTQRLYYADSYTTHFEARLVDQAHVEGRPAVILDQSYFYPTGGGQPHDLGTLNGQAVLDVQTRPSDQAVLHIVEQALQGADVQGQVDWVRRFDHMGQHTGQHILSRAFIEVRGAQTVGFHLSNSTLTIDVDQSDVPNTDLEAVEALANQIIAENRAVRAWFPSAEEWADLSLRKISEKVTGAVRVVQVEGFDLCACGGTHVAQTGEIGQIKIIRAEKNKQLTRVEFRCGGRALADYRHKNALVLQLASQLTVGYWELPTALERLQDENKALQRDLKAAQSRLLALEAQALWSATPAQAGRVVIAQAFDGREVSDLNGLASHFVKNAQTVALLGLAGPKGHLIFAASPDLALDVVSLLKNTLAGLGSQSGGGRGVLAQGGGFSSDLASLQAILEAVKQGL
jgi:alanyl-tRNA synthetase